MKRLTIEIVAVALLASVACGDRGITQPSPPPLQIEIPSMITGRLQMCVTCSPAFPVVAEFPVTIGDAFGGGGVVESVETRIQNVSRGSLVAVNVRPNGEFGYPDTSVPANGRLVLQAGVVFDLPPPRDEIRAIVTVRLTDGRQAITSAPVIVVS
jgi:hypothetical protein